MKLWLVVACLLSIAQPAAAIEVRYKVSRTHGLLKFVLGIAGEQHENPGLKVLFERSRFHDEKHLGLLADWESVRGALGKEVNSSGKQIPFRERGSDVMRLVKTQAIFATSLSDLSERTLGLMPMSEHLKLFRILGGFDDAFEALVWKPYAGELRLRRKKFEEIAKRINLSEMFTKDAVFYRAQWPEGVAFTVGLYAIPWLKDFKNSTHSSSMGSVEEHGVQTGTGRNPDLSGDFGVIFHEMSHSLYDTESDDVMEELARAFAATGSPYSRAAQAWINEGLATAIGNGWAFARANGGQEDPKSWYANSTVDRFAHAIYPEVADRLKSGGTFDAKFVAFAVPAFARVVPEVIYAYSEIFNRVDFAHNRTVIEGSALRVLAQSEFHPYNFSVSAPLEHEETVKQLQESEMNIVFVLGKGESAKLGPVFGVLPFLAARRAEVEGLAARSIWSAVDEKGRAFVVIRADTAAELAEAFRRLSEWKTMDPQKAARAY